MTRASLLPRPAPGSFLWLALADLRLTRRAIGGLLTSMKRRSNALVLGGAALAFHAIAWPVGKWLALYGADEQTRWMVDGVVFMGLLFVAPWLISHALTAATRALYGRGDLDMLLASPLPASRILATRAITIWVETTTAVGVFLMPIANTAALAGGFRWLALYPTLAACALLATSFGIALALGLFALVGPRRTRQISQVAAMVIGASFVIALQGVNFLPTDLPGTISEITDIAKVNGLLAHGSLLWAPIRAAQGDLAALGLWFACGALTMGVSALALGRLFVRAVRRAAGYQAPQPLRRADRRIRFLAGASAALRRKEWRLLRRDPWVISQIALQALYTLPIAAVLWRLQGEGASLGMSVAPAAVIIASQLSASIAWLTISSEDAPEFIETAPITRAQVERRKLEAVALPLVCLLGPITVLVALSSPFDALAVAVFATGAAASTALVNLWHPMPARRSALMARGTQSKLVALVEHLLSLLWGIATVMLMRGSWITLLPLALVALVLWLNWPRGRPALSGVANARAAH